MLLIGIDLAFKSLYVVSIWFVQRKIINLLDDPLLPRRNTQMKTLAIRTFVVALAVAGFTASSMYSASTTRTNEAKVMVAHPGVVRTPATTCGPGSTCGLD
jgi:hypothetical protein